MKSMGHKITTLLLCLCVSFLLISRPAKAQYIGTTRGQEIGFVVGVAVAGAALGVGIYFLVRRSHSITGCVASAPGGLALMNEGDQHTYALIGDTSSIKPGDRIRVSGKRKKKDASGNHDFLVEKVAKDCGACKTPAAAAATP